MTPPTTSEPTRRPVFLRPGGPLATACFLGVELVLLATAHLYGGPPWTLLMMIALLAQVAGGIRLAPLAVLAPSLTWLAAYRATGNRELFFPFAMHLATFVALLCSAGGTGRAPPAVGGMNEAFRCRHPPCCQSAGVLRGLLGGGGVVAAFLAIRGLQDASLRVLAVESAVAFAILAMAATAHAATGMRAVAAPAIVIVSSLAAYAALAL